MFAPPPGLRGIVFDLDGTLYVDRELGREIRAAAARYVAGLKGVPPEEADRLISVEKRRLKEESGWETPLSRACAALGGDVRELHRRFADEVAPEPYLVRDERVIRLLTRLNERCVSILYTNNNRALSGRIMRGLGIDGLFRRVYTIEDVWEPKPNPAMIRRILDENGLRPEETLFVGDRYDVDLRVAAEMGAPVHFVAGLDDLLELESLL